MIVFTPPTKRSTYRVTIEREGPDASDVMHASFAADSFAAEAGLAVLVVLRRFYELHPEAAGERLTLVCVPLERRDVD